MAELPTARPFPRRCRPRGVFVFLAALITVAFVTGFAGAPALAQTLVFPKPVAPAKKTHLPKQAGKDQMLVQAREIEYDQKNHRVSAVGQVQIFYNGSTIQADRVIYDEATKRLHAEGNVRLTDEEGNISNGELMDLSDDYRDGFVDSLHLDTKDYTRLSAPRANRTGGGNYTVFENGVYTACLPCKDDPQKPPLWQVKSARIIHDKGEKMIYFEDARIEFFGMPIAYLPYFSTPDPTVKRKTGFLYPIVGYSTIYGASAETPYFWNLAPNYDATFSPMLTTKQGALMQGEFRQRLMSGSYAIRAAGIYQLDKNFFAPGAPGNRDFRGSIESEGRFALNDKWNFGWNAIYMTDRSFMLDYKPTLSQYRNGVDPTRLGIPGSSEAISQVYVTGKGSRSFFDARSIYFYGYSNQDQQNELPFIRPVIDYDYTFAHPILGGEVSTKTNFTSLSRKSADFDAISNFALQTGACASTADPALKTSANCLLRGIPGDYTRFSNETTWRRSFTDRFGQVFTPFASVRVDVADAAVVAQPGVANYLPTGDHQLVRAMPTVGMEYRYPFISVHSWGTQTIEPIAQVIARPNESKVTRWPNEDAQSLTFDDSNLFKVNKFAGWDRIEGGGRANAGINYTAQFNQGGSINALFGQSYQLFGANSFAMASPTNTGLQSGLDTNVSDYVARLSFSPNRSYMFTTRFRFDHDTFSQRRFEFEARANYDRWQIATLYGDYAAQPALGFLNRRQGILTNVNFKLDTNWSLFAGGLYDLNANKVTQTRIGVGYIDDCFILALNYTTSYSYDVNGGNPQLVHAVLLQFNLRTLGGQLINSAGAGPGLGLP